MKRTTLCKLFIVASALTFARSQAADAPSEANRYLSDFYKGNLYDKMHAVEESAGAGESDIALRALDFCILAYDQLKDDGQFNALAETSVKALNPGNCREREDEAGQKLRSVFTLFSNADVKGAVVDAFSVFPSPENISVVNDFFYERMQQKDEVDVPLLKSILYMGIYGDSSSFNMMFIADILDIWPSYKDILASSYGSLAAGSEDRAAEQISALPVEQKETIIKRLNENPKISKNLCARVAENTLSAVINKGDKTEGSFSQDDLSLVLLCLDTISGADWTRASSLALSCFEGLMAAYEDGLLSADEFSKAISDIASVPAPETSGVLLSYLDTLNRSAEDQQGNASGVDTTVALSVIKAIGGLGDKNSFDTLLYSTYLNYPEEVIAEARDALSKLKW